MFLIQCTFFRINMHYLNNLYKIETNKLSIYNLAFAYKRFSVKISDIL